MSRIGAKAIELPPSVTLEVKPSTGSGQGETVVVKGPKGELAYHLLPEVKVEVADGKVRVRRNADTSDAKARHGLTRSLLKNMVQGVAAGHERSLEIVGVGYRAQPKGKILSLSLGFSHPVEFAVPAGIEITQDEKNKNLLTIRGADKQLVGQVAADIRSLRPPEPYKGKGIRFTNETVRRKPGKAAAAKAVAA